MLWLFGAHYTLIIIGHLLLLGCCACGLCGSFYFSLHSEWKFATAPIDCVWLIESFSYPPSTPSSTRCFIALSEDARPRSVSIDFGVGIWWIEKGMERKRRQSDRFTASEILARVYWLAAIFLCVKWTWKWIWISKSRCILVHSSAVAITPNGCQHLGFNILFIPNVVTIYFLQ